MNVAAPTCLQSKGYRKSVLCVAFLILSMVVMVIPTNENICKNQLVWMRMDFIAKPNQKQLHAPQRGENTCSCGNLNILGAVQKEEHRDMGRNLSHKCEERLSWLAT